MCVPRADLREPSQHLLTEDVDEGTLGIRPERNAAGFVSKVRLVDAEFRKAGR